MIGRPRSFYSRLLTSLAAFCWLAGGGTLGAQPGLGGDDSITFEVQSIDPQKWVVTARDLEGGAAFSFRLPPEAFRGQRFRADLADAVAGRKISVEAAKQARLREAVIERPIGAGSPSASGSALGETPRFDRDRAPGPSSYGRSTGRQGPADYLDASGRPAKPGRPGSGPTDYEVMSVDARNWTVEARGSDGSTVSLEIDPQAFVGYRFQASVKELRAGQGFELLATNERPLADCCVVKALPRR